MIRTIDADTRRLLRFTLILVLIKSKFYGWLASAAGIYGHLVFKTYGMGTERGLVRVELLGITNSVKHHC